MGIYYSTECNDIGSNAPSCCGDDELARVRSIAYIHRSVVFADITDATEWKTYIAAKLIFIVPNTQGSYTPSEKTAAGFGDEALKMMGYDHKISYKDPDVNASQITWYNLLKRSNRYYAYYRTETQGYLSGKPVTVIPKNPVQDDITAKMTVDVDVVWSHQDLPVPHAIPADVFDCFLVV